MLSDMLAKQRALADQKERKRAADAAIADKEAAKAELLNDAYSKLKTFAPPNMQSRVSLWKPWAQGVTMQGGAKAKKLAGRCSTVLPTLTWASQQPRKMIGHGSRTLGTTKWSPSMGKIWGPFLLDGCRTF